MIGADLEVLLRLAWAKLGGAPELTLADIERMAAARRAQFATLPPHAPIELLQQVRLLDSIVSGAKLHRELGAEPARAIYDAARPS